MLSDVEIMAIAKRVVAESKRTSRYETGALMRSMAVTNQRGVYEFRELVHGKYNDNSKLEENAARMMPRGVAWKIVYTKFGGGIAEVGRTRQGRATQGNALTNLIKSTTSKIRNLIAGNKARNGKA
jgi:hypothetical protein